jgi:hypothetical protein
MLELTDPLWEKLDDALRDQNVPKVLSELAGTWNDEMARSLFWDNLSHQGTCYGATYAAVPHLLKIAEPDAARHQRFEIAVFLGYVALCALESGQAPPLPGLPETLEEWDRKLDCYRSLVASFEDPDRGSSSYKQAELLPRYKSILAVAPVNAGDLRRIRETRAEFLAALPSIGALCERALLECADDKHAVRYLLSGIAAADGLFSVGRLLNSGDQGLCKCSTCGWGYYYMRFGERIAIYAETTMAPGRSAVDDRVLQDYKAQAPSNADGFVSPVEPDHAHDVRATRLISLAAQATSPEPALLLRHFLGRMLCRKCGAQGAIQGT